MTSVCLFGRRFASSLNWYSDGQRALPSVVHLSNSWCMSAFSRLRASMAAVHSSSTVSSVFHGGVAGRIAFAIRRSVCFASFVSTVRSFTAAFLAVVATRCKSVG